MFDPIGAFNRMTEQFRVYLDTAYRIENSIVSDERRKLLAKFGTLALDPIFEAVPRYVPWEHGLEQLIDDDGSVLPGFTYEQRRLFVELVLSGLFDSKPAENSIGRAGRYRPYQHQIDMLKRGVRDGCPGIVTSGTGSGKTESFLLPILAQIAKEAAQWPKVKQPLNDDWLSSGEQFRFHRHGESADRPQAVRALILYPLNALVEDQMVRLRKAIDSPEARQVMDRQMNGNRIFFARYTGKTPVPGYRVHPRLSDDPKWKERKSRRTGELKKQLQEYQTIHRRIAEDADTDDDLRYLFPSTDGGELISRWDIQESPPDILVTNQSILNAILVREVDAPIIAKTRDWLLSNSDARFFLVLDELHLIRGSAGAETSSLLRVLLDKLGLTDPAHSHKLRVLSSSASLPMDEKNEQSSLDYLMNMFGSAGTGGEHVDARRIWSESIVAGETQKTALPEARPDQDALRGLAAALSKPNLTSHSKSVKDALLATARSIEGLEDVPDNVALTSATATAAAMLEFAMQDGNGSRVPRSTTQIGQVLFGGEDQEAVRGLMALRAIPDFPTSVLPDDIRPRREDVETLPGLRMHCFVRNIEGMFCSLSVDEQRKVTWGTPSIERGEDFEIYRQTGKKHRLFEMLYCEACGDLYVGGKRGGDGRDGGGKRISLLPAPEELEKLPESAASLRFEDASYQEFALFWPGQTAPLTELSDGSPYRWLPAALDPSTGVISDQAEDGHIPGYLLHRTDKEDFHQRDRGDDGTAVPYCCAKCGTDYSGRFRAGNSKKREGRKSPIRSFRTGFGKTSQLLATELVAALKAQGGDGKLVAFSDSREDAAKLALDVEVQHQRDLRREILITAAAVLARDNDFTHADAEEMSRLAEAMKDHMAAKDFAAVADTGKALAALQQREKAQGFTPSIPLSDLFEFQRGYTEGAVRPIVSTLLDIGSTPVEGADTHFNRVGNRPWHSFFRSTDEGYAWNDKADDTTLQITDTARKRVFKEQPLEAADLLFSKTYFALEETGLGWPSFYGAGEYTPEKSEMDAWLRLFSDAYRVTPNQFQEQVRKNWNDAREMLGVRSNRLRSLLQKIFPDPIAAADAALQKMKDLDQRDNGSIDLTRLYFRTATPGDLAWRCTQCARVHLHRGFGKCTRCGEELPEHTPLTADAVVKGNFLGRRVLRAVEGGEPHFRLKCEELTGQTQDPAARLQQFKGVFVAREDETKEAFEARRKFETADLLSVTTTMEVGVDIGSLQAVYQGNMPPQRFNYQQRVGRAGRRGQAFSAVLTVCRSKSHDIHYFRNPLEITGSAPPPPFITTGLVDIPSRLLRKFWLVEAFELLRQRHAPNWAGDNMVPADIHGEFLYCNEYFNPERDWPDQLSGALQSTVARRDALARVLAVGAGCGIESVTNSVTVEGLLEDIEGLRGEYQDLTVGLAEALAERGLLPLYGMPTRSRDLYVDLEKKDNRKKRSDEALWDTISRDQDVAIFDFAPGSVRTREKLYHRAIGFTGVLKTPDPYQDDLQAPQTPLSNWFKDDFRLAFCATCGIWTRDTTGHDNCPKCGADLSSEVRSCVTPTAYRTEFKPSTESLPSRAPNRITLASLGDPDDQRNAGNLEINFAERSEVFNVNPGPKTEDGFAGFNLQTVTDLAARTIWFFPDRPVLKLENQGIAAEIVAEEQSKWRGDGEVQNRWLASTKITNSLQIGPARLNKALRLDDLDVGLSMDRRDPARTSVRAAAVSATELIVQRASLDLDIAPEEFDALAPTILPISGGGHRPYLQLADALPNGSGFCRHLLASNSMPVSELIDSILDDPDAWPRKVLVGDAHQDRCGTSCYRCLQRYNNRNYHGLLDWRLGLSYLRAMRDPDHLCGLDGKFEEQFELSDWQESAEAFAEESRTYLPGNQVKHVGALQLPAFSLDSKQRKWAVVVHPLWSRNGLLDRLGVGKEFIPVDTFELSRRPLQVIQRAQNS